MPVKQCSVCKQFKTNIRNIYSALVKRAKELNMQLITNGKICAACYRKIFKLNTGQDNEENNENSAPGPSGVQKIDLPQTGGNLNYLTL